MASCSGAAIAAAAVTNRHGRGEALRDVSVEAGGTTLLSAKRSSPWPRR
jgi:hypothetical protein